MLTKENKAKVDCLERVKWRRFSNKTLNIRKLSSLLYAHYSMSPTLESQSRYLVEHARHPNMSSSVPTNKSLVVPTHSSPLGTLPVVRASVFPTYPTSR